MCWIIFVNMIRLWVKKKRPLGEFCNGGIFVALQRFITCLCFCVFELRQCVCLSACLHACMWTLHTFLVRVAWNDEVKTAQAWGWAACCCALLSTICLCQKYLLCAEWGMKSIQVLFSQLLLLEGSKKLYWYLPDQPTLSNVTTGHQWHSQTDHLVSSVQ